MNITNIKEKWNSFSLVDDNGFTYISENNGYFKIGQSIYPINRGSKFGNIIFIAKNSKLEKMLFSYFGKCGAVPYILSLNEKTQEWVKVDKKLLLSKAIEYCDGLNIDYVCETLSDELLITINSYNGNKESHTSKCVRSYITMNDYNDMNIILNKLNITEKEFINIAISNQIKQFNNKTTKS